MKWWSGLTPAERVLYRSIVLLAIGSALAGLAIGSVLAGLAAAFIVPGLVFGLVFFRRAA